jgi:hypothetical protein
VLVPVLGTPVPIDGAELGVPVSVAEPLAAGTLGSVELLAEGVPLLVPVEAPRSMPEFSPFEVGKSAPLSELLWSEDEQPKSDRLRPKSAHG